MTYITSYRHPRIAVDLDNTLAGTVKAQLKTYKKEGIKIRKGDIHTPDIQTELLRLGNIKPDKSNAVLAKIWENTKSMPLQDKSTVPVMNLISSLYSVTILTATIADLALIKEWLSINSIIYRNIIKLPYKDKVRFVKECHIHMFIDDDPILAKEVDRSDKKVIVINQPWNNSVAENSNIRRAKSWSDVPALLDHWE